MYNSELQFNADTVVPRQSGSSGGPENSRVPCPSQIISAHCIVIIIIIIIIIIGILLRTVFPL